MIYKICPAIMAIDPFFLKKTLALLESLEIKCLHADVLDGVFTPFISMGINYFESIAKNSTIPIELHLQVTDPIKQIQNTNLDLFERVIFHAERVTSDEIIDIGTKIPCKIGIAFNPNTDLSDFTKCLMNDNLEKLVIMASEPGTSMVIPSVFEKIATADILLKKMGLRSRINIQIDAGIRLNNINQFKKAGANEFVCASAIFSGDISKNYKNLISELNIEEELYHNEIISL